MKEVVGIIHFENPVPCRGDVLQGNFTAKIGNVDVQLFFPTLQGIPQDREPDLMHMFLKKPTILGGTREDNWGCAVYYSPQKPDNLSSFGILVKQIVLAFQSDDDTMEVTVNQLCDGINTWRFQLYERIQLLGKPLLSALDDGFFERRDRATGIELYDSQDYSLVQTNGVTTLTAHLHTLEDYLTRDDMEQLLDIIDISKELKPEYQIYLKALMEQNAGHTRYAILEATTACELCVTGRIRTRCDEIGVNGNGLCDALYRSLGDRFNLLKYLGVTLASHDPNKEIVKPRNNLFHNRTITPTLKECNNVLIAVRKYLNTYIPEPYE